MIPNFPIFKKLNVSLRDEIEKFVSSHFQYSTHNYKNLHAWNLGDKMKVSVLQGNLIFQHVDRMTGEIFFTFIGEKKPVTTVKEISQFSLNKYGYSDIRFLTEPIKKRLERTKFKIIDDRNSYEYVYDLSKIAFPRGKKLKSKRLAARRFKHLNPDSTFCIEDISSLIVQKEILSLTGKWSKNKHKALSSDDKNEETALKRLLKSKNYSNLMLSVVRINGTMIAFSIDELITNRQAIGHFVKANVKFKGIFEFINEQTAKKMYESGVRLWNWQQDLGLEGLRRLKLSYQPKILLRKYQIKIKPD